MKKIYMIVTVLLVVMSIITIYWSYAIFTTYVPVSKTDVKITEVLEENNDNVLNYTLTVYYDVPLSKELQDYTNTISDEYDVPVPLILAIMEKESNFDVDAKSSTNDYGIMQINKCNHTYLKETLGFTDIMNAKNNIHSGVFMVSKLYHKYDNDLHKTMMAYNCGEAGARKLWNKGVYSTEYSRGVVKLFEAYNRPVQNG